MLRARDKQRLDALVITTQHLLVRDTKRRAEERRRREETKKEEERRGEDWTKHRRARQDAARQDLFIKHILYTRQLNMLYKERRRNRDRGHDNIENINR